MHDLNYQLKNLAKKYPVAGRATQRDREYALSLIANQLWEAGYKDLDVDGLKGRHVNALVERWKKEELSPGTIKNRMSALRWWAETIGKKSLIAKSNSHYGIAPRTYVTKTNKAVQLSSGDLERVRDFHVRLSLELQSEFGLRREESIKFRSSYADRGDHIRLKASWTKGGRYREIPITTESQRALLDRVRDAAGRKALIPPDRTYKEQLKAYERETAHAGLSKMHGLRHEYAQCRYEKLTGWKAPAAGGPGAKELTVEQKAIGREARLTISRELGHEREQITGVYLGR